MTHLYVELGKVCTASYYAPEEYGEWSETWDNEFRAVYAEDGWDREKVPVDYEVKQGDIVYVVWAEWSSGNSFGRDHNGHTDVVHVFKDKDLAWDCYRALMGDPKSKSKGWDEHFESWTAKFLLDSGKEMPYHRSWLGYFDDLGEIHVEEAMVV